MHIFDSQKVHSLEYALQEIKAQIVNGPSDPRHHKKKKRKEQSVPQTKSEREHRVISLVWHYHSRFTRC